MNSDVPDVITKCWVGAWTNEERAVIPIVTSAPVVGLGHPNRLPVHGLRRGLCAVATFCKNISCAEFKLRFKCARFACAYYKAKMSLYMRGCQTPYNTCPFLRCSSGIGAPKKTECSPKKKVHNPQPPCELCTPLCADLCCGELHVSVTMVLLPLHYLRQRSSLGSTLRLDLLGLNQVATSNIIHLSRLPNLKFVETKLHEYEGIADLEFVRRTEAGPTVGE